MDNNAMTFEERKLQMATRRLEVIPNMPRAVQKVYDGFSVLTDGSDDFMFYDFNAEPVRSEMDSRGQPFFAEGYYEALWDLRNLNLIGEETADGKVRQLYRRDHDPYGNQGRVPQTWHAVTSIADEYNVPSKHVNPMFDVLITHECELLTWPGSDGVEYPWRIHRGVKFRNRGLFRGYNEHGESEMYMTEIGGMDPDTMNDPFELYIDRDWDEELIADAERFLRLICADDNSFDNLLLMPAAPFLEEYKHLTFVLAGEGGNGKGTLFGAFLNHGSTANLATTVRADVLTGGSKVSATMGEQEPYKLAQHFWAFDEDANALDSKQTMGLKKLSTGDELSARKLGQNMVTFRPKATLCVATNLDFVTDMDVAMRRRFAFVRMQDGHTADDLKGLRRFIFRYGADGFVMASCARWMRNRKGVIKPVQIGQPARLSDAEAWAADQIVLNGFVSLADSPYRMSNWEKHDCTAKFGLRPVRRDGKQVYRVADENRFAPYRANSELMIAADGHTEPPKPLNRESKRADELGFGCDYTPARRTDKVALNWKKNVADPNLDTSVPPAGAEAFACVPRKGFTVIDFDRTKTGGMDGWARFVSDVGEYGSMAFPATYVVRTPSGGAHAYYRTPETLLPEGVNLKDSVHSDGIPVDLRTDGKGYVLAAGSHTDAGDYRVADDHPVADMSRSMVAWLREHGYTTEKPKASHKGGDAFMHTDGRTAGQRNDGFSPAGPPRPNRPQGRPAFIHPVEGERNDRLYRHYSGRYINHPEDRERIHDDLIANAAAVGISQGEAEHIFTSIVNGKR